MHYKKYESDNLYLTPVSEDDINTILKWRNDEYLMTHAGDFDLNFNEINYREKLKNKNLEGIHCYLVIKKEEDKAIGIYELVLDSLVFKRYHIGGSIGEKEERGKGYGTEALSLITKYAFEVLNAESIYSHIYEFNEASLKTALKVGYKQVGKFRNAYYLNGKYHDKYCIDIISEDYYKGE